MWGPAINKQACKAHDLGHLYLPIINNQQLRGADKTVLTRNRF